jgi:hypothetical protein
MTLNFVAQKVLGLPRSYWRRLRAGGAEPPHLSHDAAE